MPSENGTINEPSAYKTDDEQSERTFNNMSEKAQNILELNNSVAPRSITALHLIEKQELMSDY